MCGILDGNLPVGVAPIDNDVAGVAVFLASDEARYTTAALLTCDGGQAVGYYLSVPGRRFSGGRID